MAQDNLVDIEIPADVHVQAMGHIEGLNACLMPYLKTLTTDERKELFKLGDKNQSFLDKNLEYANQNPDLVPMYLNLELMTRDVNANAQLTSYVRRLSPLVVALDDTVMLTGAESLQGAMMFYHNVKLAASNGVTKAKAIYDDLSIRFPGGRSKRTEPV